MSENQKPKIELTDCELGLLCQALLEMLPRTQEYVCIVPDETVEVKDLLFKLVKFRQIAYGTKGKITVGPHGAEANWEAKS